MRRWALSVVLGALVVFLLLDSVRETKERRVIDEALVTEARYFRLLAAQDTVVLTPEVRQGFLQTAEKHDYLAKRPISSLQEPWRGK